MLTEDYLIRQINLAIAALLQILGLKKKGDYPTALGLIDATLEQLLGLRASMVKNLDDERLYFLLTRNEQLDVVRLAIVADLFQEEGDIYAAQGRLAESATDYTRALRYNLEVLFNESDVDRDEIAGKVETLAACLGLTGPGAREDPGTSAAAPAPTVSKDAAADRAGNPGPAGNGAAISGADALGADTLWPLAGYYEETGAYARAEAILLNLATRPDLRDEILPELVDFYQRIVEIPPEKLSAGGITVEHVREQLARFRQ